MPSCESRDRDFSAEQYRLCEGTPPVQWRICRTFCVKWLVIALEPVRPDVYLFRVGVAGDVGRHGTVDKASWRSEARPRPVD